MHTTTRKKTSPKSSRPPRKTPKKKKVPTASSPQPLLKTRFSPQELLGHFTKLLSASLLEKWMAGSDRTFYDRAFTPLITLWYMMFQRLNDKHTLGMVLEDAREGGADRLSPKGKRLSSCLESESTGPYSDARQRSILEVFRQAMRYIGQKVARSFVLPKSFGLRTVLVDGSTFRMRPFGNIAKKFPPHRPGNCKRDPYWCVARVVGLICQATGMVLDCAVGTIKDSEQALSASLFQAGSWAGCLLVGDRNFGVYSIARSIVAAKGHALLRLTKARVGRLARTAGANLEPGLDVRINWSPSRHDQCPKGITAKPIEGRLLALPVRRPGGRSFTLYLFTTLIDPDKYPVEQLLEIYGVRWDIEVCFRYIKTQMDMSFLTCRSADMARKEWFAGLAAYNLIRWIMSAAAAINKMPMSELSFSRTRELLVGWLVRVPIHRRSRRSWKRLLTRISKARLPKRRKPRPSEPRAVRPFQKDHAKLTGSRAEARKKLAEKYAKS